MKDGYYKLTEYSNSENIFRDEGGNLHLNVKNKNLYQNMEDVIGDIDEDTLLIDGQYKHPTLMVLNNNLCHKLLKNQSLVPLSLNSAPQYSAIYRFLSDETGTILLSNNKKSDRHRRLVSSLKVLFGRTVVESRLSYLDEEIGVKLDEIVNFSEIDFSELCSDVAKNIASRDFSISSDERNIVFENLLSINDALAVDPRPRMLEIETSLSKLFEFFDRKIVEVDACNQNNFLKKMINEMRSNGFDLTDVSTQTIALLAASIETTESAVSATATSLIQNPEYLDFAITNEENMKICMHEAMRYWGVLTDHPLVALEDFQIDNLFVKSGQIVIVSLLGAGRDERTFNDQGKFIVPRKNLNSSLSYGTGPHTCLGRHQADLVGPKILSRFFSKYSVSISSKSNPLFSYGYKIRKWNLILNCQSR